MDACSFPTRDILSFCRMTECRARVYVAGSSAGLAGLDAPAGLTCPRGAEVWLRKVKG